MAGPIEHIPGHEVDVPAYHQIRKDVLEGALKIGIQRDGQYGGNSEETHRRIGVVWGAILEIPAVDPRTVALMMVGLKVIRGTTTDDLDSYVDASNYSALAAGFPRD